MRPWTSVNVQAAPRTLGAQSVQLANASFIMAGPHVRRGPQHTNDPNLWGPETIGIRGLTRRKRYAPLQAYGLTLSVSAVRLGKYLLGGRPLSHLRRTDQRRDPCGDLDALAVYSALLRQHLRLGARITAVDLSDGVQRAIEPTPLPFDLTFQRAQPVQFIHNRLRVGAQPW